MVRADYTVNGKTFASREEFQQYMDAYMEAWHEVYGSSANTSYSTYSYSSTKSTFSIDTTSSKNIGPTSAQLFGKISFQNSKLVRIWFEYGVRPNNLYVSTESEVLDRNNGSSKFDRNITNLQPETQYYYRAVGLNDKGVYVYGSVQSFVTDVDIKSDKALVRVNTSSAGDTQDNRTTLRGTIDFRKQTFAYVWFQYSEEEKDLYRETPHKLVYKTAGKNIAHTITKLDSETYYYYRMVGEDQNGNRSYSKTVCVGTKRDIVGEKPKVATDKVGIVDVYSAKLSGTVDMNDYRNGVVFLVYGENLAYINEIATEYRQYTKIKEQGDDIQKILLDDDLDSFGTFSKKVEYLDIGTKYFYAIGLEYENEEGDNVLLMGRINTFATKKI
jgi:hypothetical protein